MNILLNKFPTKIKVGKEICDIDSDFRNCLRIIMAYEDTDLTISEQYYIMLKRLYKTIPNDIEEAIKKGILFLNCGKDNDDISDNTKRVYRFDKDAEYDYSAINQTHNIY